MELGEKLRQARLEAGLSQRQLCGGHLTRNMLSLIENGNARPSMDTLKYLASRLGKPVSYFLEEDAVTSPNQGVMEFARRLYDAGEYAEAALVLEAYQRGDPIFDREESLLRKLTLLAQAEQAIEEKREPYALELLEKAKPDPAYCAQATAHTSASAGIKRGFLAISRSIAPAPMRESAMDRMRSASGA